MSVKGNLLKDIFSAELLTCDICGIETFGSNLCLKCYESVSFNDGITCPVCGRRIYIPQLCIECKYIAPNYKKAVSALVYEGGTVKLISKFKNGYGYLKDYFADLVIKKLDSIPVADCIVYVPLTRKAKTRRGFNQSELIAKSISARTDIPVIENAVTKCRETDEQKSLTYRERIKNLTTSFKVEKRREIKDKTILVIDDILTTGATADAMSMKLLKAGAKYVYIATVASVEYRMI